MLMTVYMLLGCVGVHVDVDMYVLDCLIKFERMLLCIALLMHEVLLFASDSVR